MKVCDFGIFIDTVHSFIVTSHPHTTQPNPVQIPTPSSTSTFPFRFTLCSMPDFPSHPSFFIPLNPQYILSCFPIHIINERSMPLRIAMPHPAQYTTASLLLRPGCLPLVRTCILRCSFILVQACVLAGGRLREG